MNSTGCLVCGEVLNYSQLEINKCFICGNEFSSEVKCVNNHYICDSCHKSDAVDVLEKFIATTNLTDPIKMADILMNHSSFKMHGTEHHYLVPAVVVKSIKNSGYEVNDLFFNIVKARCTSLPGGTCGYWGACSTAIGSGISASIVLKVNPLSQKEYSTVHKFTRDAIDLISQKNGPRCCKRNIYSSILSTVESFKKYSNIEIKASNPVCSHFKDNVECLKKDCPYFPGA